MDVPKLPKTSYYDSSDLNTNISATTLKKNVSTSCIGISSADTGIFKTTAIDGDNSTLDSNISPGKNSSAEIVSPAIFPAIVKTSQIPSDISSLDIPVFLARNGNLTDATLYNAGIDTAKPASTAAVPNPSYIRNQIRYLACQLIPSSNTIYDSKDYMSNTSPSTSTIKQVFSFSPAVSFLMVIVFIISMFLLINGLFSSMDLVKNIFGKLEKTNKNTIFYWIGILIGLSIPMLILVIVYASIIMNNVSNLENYEITNKPYPYTNKNSVPPEKKSLDISTIFLFIILIYAFVAVLFTIKKESFSPILYTSIISIILGVIAIFMYILYTLVPFFNSANTEQINKLEQQLRLFITDSGSSIMSNQQDDNSLRLCFVFTFVAVFFLSLIYFAIKSENSLVNGIFGSCAILVIPALWLLNFSIGIQYFFAYPIILVIARFVRYSYMSVLYIMCERNPSMKDGFSGDLAEKLTNFQNYSPTWGLLGVDEMKVWINIYGYENTFSKSILPEDTANSNLSSNRYITGIFGLTSLMKDSNKSSMIYSICIWVLAVIVTMIVLKSV